MASIRAPPAELRVAAPFVQRAKEMEKADPVIAYWCLFHAAQTAMNSRANSPDSRAFLMELLDRLEAIKATLVGNDALTDETAAAAYVENFALKVFSGADDEDRAGQASRATAMRFLAASTFLEVLTSVSSSEVDPDITAKLKYAKWKASDISKALKAGVKPTPGPPGASLNEDGTDSVGVEAITAPGVDPVSDKEADAAFRSALEADDEPTPSAPPSLPQFQELPPPSAPAAADPPFPSSVFPSAPAAPGPASFPSAPTVVPSPPKPVPPPQPYTPPVAPVAARPPPPAPQLYEPQAPPATGLDPMRISEIQKHARWAISALNYEDVDTAKKELQLALSMLG